MTAMERVLRFLAGSVAVGVGLILTLHISIVSAYAGGSSGEAVAAVILGAVIVVLLIVMWALGKPSSVLARTGVCLGLFALYLAVFMIVI